MRTETIDALSAAGSKATITGAGLAGWGWVVSNEFLGLVGACVAVLGVLVNSYYKRKADARIAARAAAEDRRREAEHQARQTERQLRMELMRATGRPMWAPERDTDLGALEVDE